MSHPDSFPSPQQTDADQCQEEGQLVGPVLALLHRHGPRQKHLSSNTNSKIVMGTIAAVTDKHSISIYLICIYFAFPIEHLFAKFLYFQR